MTGTRTVKSIHTGDTLLRLTKDNGNLHDYTVLIQDTAKDTELAVTYPAYIEADKAFRRAHKRARGEAGDLCALMGIDPGKVG